MRAALRVAVVAAVLLFSGNAAEARVGWGDWLTATTYHTDNFRILYQSDEATAAYAKAVGDYIQAARDKFFGDLGYDEPSWLEGNKLDVYIADIPALEEGGSKPLGVARGNLRNLDNLVGRRVLFNPWIEIAVQSKVWGTNTNNAWREYYLKALVAHEFFHVVQFGYDIKERSWLMEATSTWVEDKAFDPPEAQWENSGWVERFGEWKSSRKDVSTLSSKDTNEYAAAVFFQYLSERRPGNNNVVRRIWEEAAKHRGHNTYRSLATALGDNYSWGRNTATRMGDFAVATLIQSPSLNRTYSFRKLERVKEEYKTGNHPRFEDDEQAKMTGIAMTRLNGDRVVPGIYRLKPFQIGYYEVVPPKSAVATLEDVKEDQNVATLTVLARGASHRYWDFRLVEVPRREKASDPIERWTVRRFPRPNFRDEWARLEVENFPRKRVILVAVNTEAVDRDEEIGPGETIAALDADPFELAAALTTPPVVTSFIVEVEEGDGGPRSWRAVWKVTREPASRAGTWRTRTVLTEGLRYDKNDLKRVRVRVETSRPVRKPPALTIGGKEVFLLGGKDAKYYFGGDFEIHQKKFRTTVYPVFFEDVAKRLEAGEEVVKMEIALDGHDSWMGRFDERPDTAPRLTIQGDDRLMIERWEGDRTGPGGKDKLGGRKLPVHMLDPTSYLAKLEASQNGATIYSAGWRADPAREGARQLDVTLSKAYDPEAEMTVTLTFAEPVVDVRLRLASAIRRNYPDGYIVSVPAPAREGEVTDDAFMPSIDYSLTSDTTLSSFGASLGYVTSETIDTTIPAVDAALTYSVTIPPNDEVRNILKEDAQLAFYIDAKVKDGPKIDADPRSAGWYDWDDKRWYALEDNKDYGGGTDEGGTDEWHTLNAAGQSIVLLLDASGSMEDAGRMPAAKNGIAQAVANLKATDEIALIVFYGCGDIRTEVPFTDDPEEIIKAVRMVEPSGNTPLGDAIRFANNYLQRAARYPKRKLLTFSDGMTTCGSSAASAVAEIEPDQPKEEPPPEEEERPREIRWTVYRAGTDGRSSLPNYWVEAIDYQESDYEDTARDRARLTVRRYPVSYMSSRGRTVWSINWSHPRERDQRTAGGGEVPALRARAEGMREGTMDRGRVDAAVQALIGPGAVALRSGG